MVMMTTSVKSRRIKASKFSGGRTCVDIGESHQEGMQESFAKPGAYIARLDGGDGGDMGSSRSLR